MPLRDLLLLIGGPQGSGMETSGQILTSALARRGYGVLSDREYYSNIVGRHSYVHMRISSHTIPRSLTYPVHLAGFIDAESVFTHTFDIASGGWLIYDAGTDPTKITRIPSMEPQVRDRLLGKYREHGIGETVKDVVEYLEKEKGVNVVPLSFKLILNMLRQKYNMTLGQAQRFRSTIIFAAMAALLGLDADSVSYGIERRFRGREKVIEMNKFLASKLIEEIRSDYGTPLALEPSSIDIDKHSHRQRRRRYGEDSRGPTLPVILPHNPRG